MIRISPQRFGLRSKNKNPKRVQNRSLLSVTRSLSCDYATFANGEASTMSPLRFERKGLCESDVWEKIWFAQRRLERMACGSGALAPAAFGSTCCSLSNRIWAGFGHPSWGGARCPQGSKLEFKVAPKSCPRGQFCDQI